MLETVGYTAVSINIALCVWLVWQCRQLYRRSAEVDRVQTQAERNLAKGMEAYAEAKELLTHTQAVDRFLAGVAADAATNYILHKMPVHLPWIDTMGELRVKATVHRNLWQAESEGFPNDEETESEE